MSRHKDINWTLPTNPSGNIESWQYVPIAVMMDIRDELKQLNRLIGCHNTIRIPRILDQIEANTKRPKRKRKTA